MAIKKPQNGTPSQADQELAVSMSQISIAAFVETFFLPEHIVSKGVSGQTHYHAILKHILGPEEVDRVFHVDAGKSRTKLKAVPGWPYLDQVRLCDVRPEHVERLVHAASRAGYSTQTVKHIRNVIGAIFTHARKKQWFSGDNPASKVALPEMTRKEAHSLTLAQAKQVLGVMQYPEKEMTLITILTSMNVAEICGLQWKRVNLSDEWSMADSEPIPPRTLAVRHQWYRNRLSPIKQKSRKRNLPIPEPLLPILLALSHRDEYTGPDDFVLVSRNGTPLNENNLVTRRLKPIGREMEMPWLSWQVLRRTHTALAFELGMQLIDRMAMKRATAN
jgi:integrase